MPNTPKKVSNKRKRQPSSPQSSITVTDCRFVGIEWDKSSLEVVASVPRSLENLTHLFKAQNLQIEALLKIGNGKMEALVGTQNKK
jgi:hypothetical protein